MSTVTPASPKVSEELIQQFEAAACATTATVERVNRSASAIAAAIARKAPTNARIAIADPIDLPADLFCFNRSAPPMRVETACLLPAAHRARSKCRLGLAAQFCIRCRF